MKKVFITAISILLFTVGYSQSLQVVDTKYNYDLKIGDEARTVIKLKNVSDKTLHIQVRRDKAQIGSSQRSFFCWDNDCNEPYINQHYVTQVIEPGEILETFVDNFLKVFRKNLDLINKRNFHFDYYSSFIFYINFIYNSFFK